VRERGQLRSQRLQEHGKAKGQYQGAGARAVEIAEVAGARAGDNAVSKQARGQYLRVQERRQAR